MWLGTAPRGFNLSSARITPDALVGKIKAFAVGHPADKILSGRASAKS